MTVPDRWHLLWVNAMWRQINSLLSFAEARNKRSGSQINEQDHCNGRNQVNIMYSQRSKYTGRFQSRRNNFPQLFITCSALLIDKHSMVLLSVFCSFSVISESIHILKWSMLKWRHTFEALSCSRASKSHHSHTCACEKTF